MANDDDFDNPPPRRRDFDGDQYSQSRRRDGERRDSERGDYDDGAPQPPRKGPFGPLDKMFMDTSMVILVLFGLCCGWIAMILAIICVATAKQPEARSKATTVLVISAIMVVVSFVLRFTSAILG